MNYTSNNDINVFNEVRKLFNECRSNLLLKETKRIRKELYKKETVYNFLKEKEQEGSLTNKQKNVLKNIGRYLKKLNNDLKKLQKYQDNITYGLGYLRNEVNLLMITDGSTNWRYLAIKNTSGLLRGITSNHNGDFYCLNCLHSYRTEYKL